MHSRRRLVGWSAAVSATVTSLLGGIGIGWVAAMSGVGFLFGLAAHPRWLPRQLRKLKRGLGDLGDAGEGIFYIALFALVCGVLMLAYTLPVWGLMRVWVSRSRADDEGAVR